MNPVESVRIDWMKEKYVKGEISFGAVWKSFFNDFSCIFEVSKSECFLDVL